MGFFDNWSKYENTSSIINEKDFLEEFIISDIENNTVLIDNPYFKIVPYLMAKKLSSYEIQTYNNRKQEKSDNWYTWNIRPNKIDNAQQFKQKIYYKMLTEGKAVIYKSRDEFYVLDDCNLEYMPDIGYHGTKLSTCGRDIVGQAYDKDLMVVEYNLRPIEVAKTYSKNLLGRLTGKLQDAEMQALTRRYVMYIDASMGLDENTRNQLKENIKTGLKSADGSVIPLTRIIGDGSFQLLQNPLDKRTNYSVAQEIDRYINQMEKIAYDAYGYPYSSANNEDVEMLRVKSLIPIAKLLENELNYSLFSKREYLNGKRVEIQMIDNEADRQEKLIRSGINSINDARVDLGKDKINEDWADKHWMTLNYQPIELAMNGGEVNIDNTKE